MPILNYTTMINATRTASEIQAKLAKARAQAVLCEYDPHGVMCAMSFRIETSQGTLHFRLPAQIEGVLKALTKSDKVPRRLKTREQAANVAWRVLKDWIEAQLAIVEAGMAEMSEVFLPYAQTPSGLTVYQHFSSNGMKALTHD